jgi:hypothetical protein
MNELCGTARCLNPTGACLADSGCPVCFPKAEIHNQLDYLLDELLLAHAQRRKPHCDDRHIVVAALRKQIHDAVRGALAAPRAPEGPTLREALERCVVSLEGAINYHGKPAMYWENDLAFAREVLAGVPESTPPWAICGYPFDSMICVAPYGHAGAHVTSNDRFPHGLWNCEFGGGLK